MSGPASLGLQQKIRENALEVQDYLSDLATWQQQIGKRDHALRQKKVVVKEKQGGSPATTTPSEAPKASSLSPSTSTAATAPPPRSAAVPVEREELERQDGNKAFEAGNFSEAVKCYTRALSLNPRLALVFSNRAMAYLRLKPDHVKSYLRRGTARNALGRHREALEDFHKALELDPRHRQARVELRKTLELRKSAIRKAPRHAVPSFVIEEVPEDIQSIIH